MGEAACAHYTWGSIVKDASGKEVWQFDKRTYTGKELETHVSDGTSSVLLHASWV